MNDTTQRQDAKTVRMNCTNCGDPFDALVKLHGSGVIGGGLCPTCVRETRPRREETCPVDGRKFAIQAGHKRETCCRECQKIYTLMKRVRKQESGAPGRYPIPVAELKAQIAELVAARKRVVAAEDAAARASAEAASRTKKDAANASSGETTAETVRKVLGDKKAGTGRLDRLRSASRAISRPPVPA